MGCPSAAGTTGDEPALNPNDLVSFLAANLAKQVIGKDYHMEQGNLFTKGWKDGRFVNFDEIQYLVGHQYLTLVYQIDSHCRRLLYIGKERKAKSLLRFFYLFGKARTSILEVICMGKEIF